MIFASLKHGRRLWPALVLLSAMNLPVHAQQPGWHFSPLPGEGDRATMGCDRNATPTAFTCLAVRCEDDFSTAVYVHTSRAASQGAWEMTIDRENATLTAGASSAPYHARFAHEQTGWLLERIRQGTFVYLRNLDDAEGEFAFCRAGRLALCNQSCTRPLRAPVSASSGRAG